jgi:catechol 2,3-dioxygenase-like lactoylglutathione lyase family enzyme
MALELRSTVINARDLPRMVAFWQAAMGGEVRGDIDDARQYVALRGSHLAIQHSPDEDRPPGRWHLDLFTATAEEQRSEVDRLVALGATMLRHVREPDDDYVVLADPEGNLFCICLDDG